MRRLTTPGYKIAAFEGFCVAPVRRLLVRGAVDIIEDRTGQSPLGQTPKIMKVMTIAQNHACSRANPSVDQTARRRDLTATTEQTREYARIFEPATSEFGSTAHFALPAQHCVYLESGRAVERRSRVWKPRAGCASTLRRITTEVARLDELP